MRGKEEGGGGAALLVDEDVTAVFRGDITDGSSSEAIWVELRNKKGMITLLGGYYRPPNNQRELEEQMYREIADSCRSNRLL